MMKPAAAQSALPTGAPPAQGMPIANTGAQIHNYEDLSSEDREDWDNSPAKATQDSPSARSSIPQGWEGLTSKTSKMLWMRPVPKKPTNEKDLTS